MTRRAALAFFAARPRRRVAVIAHRAGQPENTLAAITSSIALGVDYVELDIRTTADGHYVLHHDAETGRTTNAKGPVAQLTLDELELKAGGPVPLLYEALEKLQPSGTGLYLDAKQISAVAIVEHLKRFRMLDRTVVYGRDTLLAELARLAPKLRIMPEAVSAARLQHWLSAHHPRVIAFDQRDFDNVLIAMARRAKADVFVDRLGPQDTETHWADAIRRGATGIQTDHPAELLAHLKR